MQKYDSIIFDLDGTLWDTVENVVKLWNIALVKAGLEPTLNNDELKRCMGLRIDQIFDKVIPHATAQQRDAVKNYTLSAEQEFLGSHGGVLYPKVEETLSQLQKTHRLFIVSNCEVGYINAFFISHGLQKYFEDFECAGRTGKPKGDNIRILIERAGLKKPVYIGDTATDRDSAYYAGVDFIYAAYGFGDIDYDVKADTFADIPEMV
ncbi:MAG: HAD family hydrolase [Clostridia bacterium]|nr:HAD family hydrolase [Clostridia bacterium]